MLFVNGLGDRSDASFHIAVIQNLLNNGYPWNSPFFPGDSNIYPYFFHYMVSILYSATSWIGEYHLVNIYEYSHILFIIPVVFSLAVLGKEMTKINIGAIFFAIIGPLDPSSRVTVFHTREGSLTISLTCTDLGSPFFNWTLANVIGFFSLPITIGLKDVFNGF